MARRLVVTLLSLAALGLMAGGAAAAPADQATNAAVGMKDSVFDPPALAVTVGTTVTWTNVGALPHTVTADDASVDSGTLAANAFTKLNDKPSTRSQITFGSLVVLARIALSIILRQNRRKLVDLST